MSEREVKVNSPNLPAGVVPPPAPQTDTGDANAGATGDTPEAQVAPKPEATDDLPPPVMAERIPSNWHVEPIGDEEDFIQATNIVTNKVFRGKVKAFSKYIKG